MFALAGQITIMWGISCWEGFCSACAVLSVGVLTQVYLVLKSKKMLIIHKIPNMALIFQEC